MQVAWHCVYDGDRHFGANAREGNTDGERGACETRHPGKALALQSSHSRRCPAETGDSHMTKTMSVRMDQENLEFLNELTREQRSDLSKAVRDMVTRGRILLAVERYKKGEASLGRAAELAGVPLGQMMTILTEFGVKSRLEKEDYLQGFKNLQKAW